MTLVLQLFENQLGSAIDGAMAAAAGLKKRWSGDSPGVH